jgi:hypothetical protein
MNKKLMAIAVGVLSALAFTVLPMAASAGEFTADCKTGAECSGTVAAGAIALSNTAGETITCSSATGTATLTSGTSTGTVNLTAHGCKETVTIFKFACNGVGQPAGTINTGNLVGHGIYVDPNKSIPGILITNVNMTFVCAGFVSKTVTGNIIGADPTPECGVFKKSESGELKTTAHGQQQYKQVTTAGTVFDLISSNDAGGAYLTSALTGTATITATGGNEVKATC